MTAAAVRAAAAKTTGTRKLWSRVAWTAKGAAAAAEREDVIDALLTWSQNKAMKQAALKKRGFPANMKLDLNKLHANMRCFKCKKKGHISKNCPEAMQFKGAGAGRGRGAPMMPRGYGYKGKAGSTGKGAQHFFAEVEDEGARPKALETRAAREGGPSSGNHISFSWPASILASRPSIIVTSRRAEAPPPLPASSSPLDRHVRVRPRAPGVARAGAPRARPPRASRRRGRERHRRRRLRRFPGFRERHGRGAGRVLDPGDRARGVGVRRARPPRLPN